MLESRLTAKVHIIAEKKDKEQFTHTSSSDSRPNVCLSVWKERGVAQEVIESGQYARSQLAT